MRFKHVFAVLCVALTAMMASAQELTETFTTADGSVTIHFPEGFTPEEAIPGGVGVVNSTETLAVIVVTGPAISNFGMPAGMDAATLVEAMTEMAEQAGEIEPLSLDNGSGFGVSASIPGVGSGYLVTLDTADGLLLGFIAARDGNVPEDFKATGLAIIGSASFIASDDESVDVVEATATPDKGSEDTEDSELSCPIPTETMDESQVLFCGGVEMELPDRWALIAGTEEVDTFATVNRDNFGVTLTTTVTEITQFYNPEVYFTDIVPFIADTSGHNTYDPQEHVVAVIEEPGRLIEVYDAAEYVELDDNAVRQVVVVITLNNDLFVTHTFTWVGALVEDERAAEVEIEEIALSTRLTDDYEGSPAFTTIDGETVFISDGDWAYSTYGYRFNEEETFLVNCPPNGEGSEAIVWGTDVYTHDSSVCLAATHAGAITLEEGGLVKVTMLPGQESYSGSAANGVTTLDFGSWDASFSVEAFELP